MVVTYPGAQAIPLSRSLASNCVTHMPILSPCDALCTGRLNICTDFTFRTSFIDAISIDCNNNDNNTTTNFELMLAQLDLTQ